MNRSIRFQLSLMMFLQFFVWGAWYVTLSTYLGEIDFDGVAIGSIYSTVNLAAIIAPLLVGTLADRFFPGQKVLAVSHLIGALLLYFASTITDPAPFYWIMLLYSLCYMPTLAIANAVAFFQMSDPGKEFPGVRVLGTIGWIVAGLIIGNLQIENTNIPLLIGAGASLVMGVYSFFLPHTPPKAKGEKVNVAKLFGLDALKLMRERSFAILIISSLLISIPLSFYYAFTNLFLNEGGMVNAAGKMAVLGQGAEILFLLLMPFFFIRLGVKKMILIGMFCWVARYLLFAYGNNDELVFMLYLGLFLHGLCYDFFFVTGQIYVDNTAAESIRSSAQGLIMLVTYGIGMYIGSIMAGNVVAQYEITNAENEVIAHNWTAVWLVPAILAAVVFIIFALLFREKKSEEVEEAMMSTNPI